MAKAKRVDWEVERIDLTGGYYANHEAGSRLINIFNSENDFYACIPIKDIDALHKWSVARRRQGKAKGK